MDANVYWFTSRPADTPHHHPFLVFDCHNVLHFHLTVFAKEATEQVAINTVSTYLYAILPFFSYLDNDIWKVQKSVRWNSPPDQIRLAIIDYLTQRFQCKVPQHKLGFRLVNSSGETNRSIRIFLSGMKLFYQTMLQKGYYQYENPFIHHLSVATKRVTVSEDKPEFPRMSNRSGIEVPRPKARLTDSYFKLKSDEWEPQILDSPDLCIQLISGGRRLPRWGKREECVTRMLFETGARVSEVMGLTLGDWMAKGLKSEVSAFSKGSHKLRVKTLRFSNDTAKLLLQYFDEERSYFDLHRYTLDDYIRLDRSKEVDLYTVSIFLTNRGTPYSVKTYREHVWNRACKNANIKAHIHQVRHWYVTMCMRLIYEMVNREGKGWNIDEAKRSLIQYMNWKSGEEILKAYDHYFDLARHAVIADELHLRMQEAMQRELDNKEVDLLIDILEVNQANAANQNKPKTANDDPRYKYLMKFGGE